MMVWCIREGSVRLRMRRGASWENDRRTVCYKTAKIAKHWWSPIVVGVLFLGVSRAILMWCASGDLFCSHVRFAVATRLAFVNGSELCVDGGMAQI